MIAKIVRPRSHNRNVYYCLRTRWSILSQLKRIRPSKAESSKSAKEKKTSATIVVQPYSRKQCLDQLIIQISFSFSSMPPIPEPKSSRATYSWGLEMFQNVMAVVHYLIRPMGSSTCLVKKKKIGGQRWIKI